MIGEKIKEYRGRRGYSRAELGRLCGFGSNSDTIIARLERDEEFPDLDKLERIAEVLCVPLEVLCSVPCRECLYRKRRQPKGAVIHLENDPGYEMDEKEYRDPDDEGFPYDNLD